MMLFCSYNSKVRNFAFLTLCLVFFASLVEANEILTVREDLGKLSEKLKFNPATDPNLYCYSPDNLLPFSDYPHGDYIASIASADNIVIFVHGFVPYSNQGKHDLQSMVKLWRHHLDIVEEQKDSAYCVVTWDTDYGHDDTDEVLAKFLTVLMPALQDRRVRLAKMMPKRANLILVGHSAGGNYIKYSLVLQRQLAQSKLYADYPLKQLSQRHNLKIVTMGTPHLGTDQADNALMWAFMIKILNQSLENNVLDVVANHAGYKSTTRGAKMLGSIQTNAPLRELNELFTAIYPKKYVTAFAAADDKYVDVASAAPAFTNRVIISASHDDFLKPEKNQKLRRMLRKIYGGNKS